MAGFEIQVTGLKQAVKELQQTPELLRESARLSVDEAVTHVRSEAIRRTAQRYNLSEETLQHYVYPRRASVTANGASGSVELQIKAVPLTEFGAQRITVVRALRQAFGRPTKPYRREFTGVKVALYVGRGARQLPGGFPLRLRGAGALIGGDKVRKRVGSNASGRGVSRDNRYEGNKMTGFRFYTFPKRLTDKLLPELQREGGNHLRVSLRVAYRKQFRGYKVLRLND